MSRDALRHLALHKKEHVLVIHPIVVVSPEQEKSGIPIDSGLSLCNCKARIKIDKLPLSIPYSADDILF